MNHAERYEYLVNKMAAIRWGGSDLDASYHAALFLMASHPALFEKMDRYLCPDGIDFTKMMRKEEFEDEADGRCGPQPLFLEQQVCCDPL